MEPDFWHRRWANNQIGFHETSANRMLLRYLPVLGLRAGARVFLPLCGKTRDIGWLRAQGLSVAGAELSPLAVDQLFEDMGIAPTITQNAGLIHYQADGIDVFAGDIFDLTAETLGRVDAIYDRAALVALPSDMRTRYAGHLHAITGGAQQLLICFAYDQSLQAGPPFSVDQSEVERLYGHLYRIEPVGSGPTEGGVRGTPAEEQVWHLYS
jgi:thiopurine S-methyltransferase